MFHKVRGDILGTFDRIQKLLVDRDIEQQDFAKAIGVRKQAISEWKNGITKSYTKYIDKIADFFGVSVDYLLGKTDSPTPPTQDQKDEFTELLKDFSPDEREQVKQYIKFIKSQRRKSE